jgi:hypothetical protein
MRHVAQIFFPLVLRALLLTLGIPFSCPQNTIMFVPWGRGALYRNQGVLAKHSIDHEQCIPRISGNLHSNAGNRLSYW